MRFFEKSALAQRYHAYRPVVHERVIREVVANRPARPLRIALDVACGTGHSTAPLTTLAPTVYGCDSSPAMLSVAREQLPGARFVRCRTEALPFPAHTLDLVTVSMALHWFDQKRFLEEMGRVLVPNGELWAYNLFFPGILTGEEGFFEWHRERYLRRYPVPPRCTTTLAGLIQSQPSDLVFVGKRRLDYEVTLTARELRNYLTTQSNIEAALQRGESLQDVDAWLDEELAPFFRDRRSRPFSYPGQVEIAAAVSGEGDTVRSS